MKKLLTTLTILLFAGGLPIGCCLGPGSCGCGDYEVQTFNINQMAMRTIDAQNNSVDTSVLYLYSEVFKSIDIEGVEYVSNIENHTPFFNAAYACSPVPPTALQNLQEIDISALNSFTLEDSLDVINPGDNLTDRFLMAPIHWTTFSTIEEFIQYQYPIDEQGGYKLVLANQPYQATTMKLKVDVLMTDGSSYSFDNETLKVK